MGPSERIFHNLSTFLAWHFRGDPEFLDINRELDAAHDESMSEFIKQYLKENDLAHLYALNRGCFDFIETLVSLIDEIGGNLSTEFKDTIKTHLELFPEIRSIVDENALIKELLETSEAKYSSDEVLIMSPNMFALGLLSYELYKTIENGPWQMDEKAHAYMCSLTIGNYKYFDYESFVYQLSRNIDCEDAIDNFIPYLQKEAKDRKLTCNVQQWYEAEVLRLIQWAEIGNIGEYVKRFCEKILIYNPAKLARSKDRAKDIVNFMYTYLRPPFALLRSDFAIDFLHNKLKKYIYDCQEVLQDNFGIIKAFPDDPVYHQARLTISTCYVFGAYRFGVEHFDIDLINDSTSYLQTSQLPDASFLPLDCGPFYNCQLSSMIIHALWISEALGWKRTIRRALKYIKAKQDSYGVWYDGKFDNSGYLTGLMLDSFELAKDNPVITFKMPDHKNKTEHIAPSVNQSKLHEIENHIEIGTIQNIFGNTFQSGMSKQKKKTAPKSSKKDDTSSLKNKYVEWKDQDKACLTVNNKGDISFRYADDDPIKLKLKSSGRPQLLLLSLCGKTSMSTCDIEELFNHKDRADKIVDSVNNSINNAIRKRGACKWSGNYEFIKRKTRGAYCPGIPIMSIDSYDHEYLINNEDNRANP